MYKLNIGGNACALGAAYKAAWGVQRRDGEAFEDFLEQRWDEEGFVERICGGYREGVWEAYGRAVEGLAAAERWVVERRGGGEGDEAVEARGLGEER